MSAAEVVFDSLLEAAHLAAPHQVPALVADHGAMLGVDDAVVYLADLQQEQLIPFLGSTGPGTDRQHATLSIDSTMAGRAFQLVRVLTQEAPTRAAPGSVRVWLPLLDGTERVGVLAVTIPAAEDLRADGRVLERRLRRLAAVVAEIVVTKTLYGDTIVKLRRRVDMSLAAEMQWGLLPPLTFASADVLVVGALEPAYEVAGDSVDYAVEQGVTRFAIFDGMGHGLHSAHLATLTVAAYRNARRAEIPLQQAAAAVDRTVHTVYGSDSFATGLLAELDTGTGELHWVSAGHPEPLLIRDGRLAKTLHTTPALPFGLEAALREVATYPVGTEHLQPGDRVVLYTDGVTEARGPDGSQFGPERLVDLLGRHSDTDLPAPETMRRVVRALLAHQQGQLRDDATLLMVEWRSGQHQTLLP